MLTGSCIIGQSGGPTAVINASVCGAALAALDSEAITGVYAAHYGIKGVLADKLFDLTAEDRSELALLVNTPASAFGSCRYKLPDPDADDSVFFKLLQIFKKYDVRYFFYNGGNDSMDTCEKIGRFLSKVGYECNVIGIPKTIDNDLFGTDHCPGFGSAARYIATSCMEIALDSRVYDTGSVTVVEIMGRNAGWLAGSASLASYKGFGPDLVYLPETAFDMDAFLLRVKEIYKRNGNAFIAVSEGIRDEAGKLIVEYAASDESKDSFGHVQLGGLAVYLAERIKHATGAKVRGIELSLLQRCAAHCASQTDIDEAYGAGSAAVEYAVSGESGKMVTLVRRNNPYACEFSLLPLNEIANLEKKVPDTWITNGGVTSDFIDYVMPLIQGEPSRKLCDSLPRFSRLKLKYAE